MQPFDPNFYTNFQFDDYRDLPVTVLEHFEWCHDVEEGSNQKKTKTFFPFSHSSHFTFSLECFFFFFLFSNFFHK